MSTMEKDSNVPAGGNSGPPNSRRMQLKLEKLSVNPSVADQINVQHSTHVDSSLTTPGPSQNSSFGEFSPVLDPMDDSQTTPSIERESTSPTTSFEFKTPTPMRAPRSANTPKSSTSLGKAKISSTKVVNSELTSERQKSVLSSKKKPAVKIASFAKASAVDRLAPTAPTNVDPSPDDSTSMSSKFSSQRCTGGSKQLITQTMLPTPALNAALRSFFNYASQSEGSPCTDASRSDEEDEDEDEDEDVEEEEILVYMQFDSKLDSDLLQPHTPFKIIGVDSEKPVLQLGNQVFEGNWNDTVGTAVFFEENPSASPGDPVFMKSPPSTLNYHSKTQKALVMSRIFVRPKDEDEDTGSGSNRTSGPMVPMAIVEVAP